MWAILVVLVAIGSLVYFGVLQPSNLKVGKDCEILTGEFRDICCNGRELGNRWDNKTGCIMDKCNITGYLKKSDELHIFGGTYQFIDRNLCCCKNDICLCDY